MAEELVEWAKEDEPYSIMPNALFQNENLSWEARGLMGYMISLPSDWIYYKSELMKHGNRGAYVFNRMWKELRNAGYIELVRIKDEQGKFVQDTREYTDKDGNVRVLTFGSRWILHKTPIKVEQEAEAMVAEQKEAENQQSELMEAFTDVATTTFQAEFDTIDSFDEQVLSEDDKELIKDEFVQEIANFVDEDVIRTHYENAWAYTKEYCKNPHYFAQYLVNNMKKQATIWKLNRAKEKAIRLQRKDFYVPTDGPWN